MAREQRTSATRATRRVRQQETFRFTQGLPQSRRPIPQRPQVGVVGEGTSETRKFANLSKGLSVINTALGSFADLSLIRDEEAFERGQLDFEIGAAEPPTSEEVRRNGWYQRRGAADARQLEIDKRAFLNANRNIRTSAEFDKAIKDWGAISKGYIDKTPRNRFYLEQFAPQANVVEDDIELALGEKMQAAAREDAIDDTRKIISMSTDTEMAISLGDAFDAGGPLLPQQMERLATDPKFRLAMDKSKVDFRALKLNMRASLTRMQLQGQLAGLTRKEVTGLAVEQMGELALRYKMPELMDVFDVPHEGVAPSKLEFAAPIRRYREAARTAELKLDAVQSARDSRIKLERQDASVANVLQQMVATDQVVEAMLESGASIDEIKFATDIMRKDIVKSINHGINSGEVFSSSATLRILRYQEEVIEEGNRPIIDHDMDNLAMDAILAGAMDPDTFSLMYPKLSMRSKSMFFDEQARRRSAKGKKNASMIADHEKAQVNLDINILWSRLRGKMPNLVDPAGQAPALRAIAEAENNRALIAAGLHSPEALKDIFVREQFRIRKERDGAELSFEEIDEIWTGLTDKYWKDVNDVFGPKAQREAPATRDSRTGQRFKQTETMPSEFDELGAVEALQDNTWSDLSQKQQSTVARFIVKENLTDGAIRAHMRTIASHWSEDEDDAFFDSIKKERGLFAEGTNSRSLIPQDPSDVKQKLKKAGGEIVIQLDDQPGPITAKELPPWDNDGIRIGITQQILAEIGGKIGSLRPDQSQSIEAMIDNMSTEKLFEIIFEDDIDEIVAKISASEGFQSEDVATFPSDPFGEFGEIPQGLTQDVDILNEALKGMTFGADRPNRALLDMLLDIERETRPEETDTASARRARERIEQQRRR